MQQLLQPIPASVRIRPGCPFLEHKGHETRLKWLASSGPANFDESQEPQNSDYITPGSEMSDFVCYKLTEPTCFWQSDIPTNAGPLRSPNPLLLHSGGSRNPSHDSTLPPRVARVCDL